MPQDENSEIMITFLRKELEASLEKNGSLEKENHELRQEVSRLRDQITSLKAHNHERKTVLWKKFQNSMDTPEQSPAAKEKMVPKLDFTEEKPATILTNAPPPKPPPTPPAAIDEVKGNKGPSAPAPPPPPPPSKSLLSSKGVRRVPEVIELYRSLTRKDSNMENKANPAGVHVFALTKNMIGEIENRSSYVLAVSILQGYGSSLFFILQSPFRNTQFADQMICTSSTDKVRGRNTSRVHKFLDQRGGVSKI